MFLKLKYILFSVIILLITTFVFVFMFSNDKMLTRNTNVDLSVYKPYILNTEINFSQHGNTEKFIKSNNGWGGQEPDFRCSEGKESVIKLYIKDGKNSSLLLTLYGFGVYDYLKQEYQTITIIANNEKVGTWKMNNVYNYYSVRIPSDLMKDDLLHINFIADKPFTSKTDPRPLGMAVRNIIIKKQIGDQTKRKIGKWIKNKLNNI